MSKLTHFKTIRVAGGTPPAIHEDGTAYSTTAINIAGEDQLAAGLALLEAYFRGHSVTLITRYHKINRATITSPRIR